MHDGYDLDAPPTGPAEPVIEVGELVPAYTGCAAPLDACPEMDELSPITHVDRDDPRVYVACAEQGLTPYPSFCPDARALERAVRAAHAGDPGSPASQTTYAWVDQLETATHLDIDEHVNLRMLEAFLDDVVK